MMYAMFSLLYGTCVRNVKFYMFVHNVDMYNFGKVAFAYYARKQQQAHCLYF